MKICLFLFNRASYSRLKYLIKELELQDGVDLHAILASSVLFGEYDRPSDYIIAEHPEVTFHKILGNHPPDKYVGDERVSTICSDIAFYSEPILKDHEFDLGLVFGDRFETLPAAQALAQANIPMMHIQGGEVTGNIDEKIRHSVTKLADYHAVSTRLAKDYLVQMGEHPHRVWNLGCPGIDTIARGCHRRRKDKEKYIICIYHPHTQEIEEEYDYTREVLDSVVEYCTLTETKCYWFWPNVDPGREQIVTLLSEYHHHFNNFIFKAKNREPHDFLRLLSGCVFVMGNSSVCIRESSYLGVPAINIGNRQAVRERAQNVITVSAIKDELLPAMKAQADIYKYPKSRLFGDGKASKYITKKILTIDPSIKGPLEYPFWPRFKDVHMGEDRFKHQRNTRKMSYGKELYGT